MLLAILSHDLRNPLHSIHMAAQLVSRTTTEDPGAARALSMIERNTETITQLTHDLIDFASTGLGSTMPLTCSPVDLEKLGRNIFEEFCFAYPQRTLYFQSEGDLTGNWDAARLRQVIANLIGNALQHGPGVVYCTGDCCRPLWHRIGRLDGPRRHDLHRPPTPNYTQLVRRS